MVDFEKFSWYNVSINLNGYLSIIVKREKCMKIEKISKIKGGRQDGAVSNGFYFSFNHLGECTVYEIKSLCLSGDAESQPFA